MKFHHLIVVFHGKFIFDGEPVLLKVAFQQAISQISGARCTPYLAGLIAIPVDTAQSRNNGLTKCATAAAMCGN